MPSHHVCPLVAPRPHDPLTAQEARGRWAAITARLPLTRGAPSAPLHGLRVLELGPLDRAAATGRTLAELGAEVLRLESPDAPPAAEAPLHVALNAGKRSVTLDPRTEEGRAAILEVIDQLSPDVVIDGAGAGGLEAIGLGEAALRARLPAVTWVRVSAWGEGGPLSDRPGGEAIVQAATGIAADLGGAGPPETLPLPVLTLGAGLLASYGALLALRARRRTGRAPTTSTSLAAAATLLQSEWLYAHPGRALPPRPDARALGSGPLHRYYEARDGWLFLAAPSDATPRLAEVPGLEALAGAPPEAWGDVLAHALSGAAVTVWQARIAHAGLDDAVAIVPRTRPRRAMGDPRALRRDLVRFRTHPGIGRVTETGPPLTLSRTPTVHLGAASPRGADTRPTLEALGLHAPPNAPPAESEIPDPARDWSAEVAWVRSQARWRLFEAWSQLWRRRA